MITYNISNAESFIKEYCLDSKETNPVKIALKLMKTPSIRMHGPEHHFLTAAVLASAYCNAKGIDKNQVLKELQVRCRKIPPAVCGYYGTCGAVMSAGAFVSAVRGATYMSGDEWQQVAVMTSRCLNEVAKSTGPRCCKRTTITVLMKAVDVTNEMFDIKLVRPKKYVCNFSKMNKECIAIKCPFYNKSDSVKLKIKGRTKNIIHEN